MRGRKMRVGNDVQVRIHVHHALQVFPRYVEPA
jgi:hypothetical protein